MPPKQLSGAAKKKKRNLDNEIRESQRGALNKYFPSRRSVDVTPISDPGQDDEDNIDGDLDVNEQSPINNK